MRRWVPAAAASSFRLPWPERTVVRPHSALFPKVSLIESCPSSAPTHLCLSFKACSSVNSTSGRFSYTRLSSSSHFLIRFLFPVLIKLSRKTFQTHTEHPPPTHLNRGRCIWKALMTNLKGGRAPSQAVGGMKAVKHQGCQHGKLQKVPLSLLLNH